jgi:O-antigen/teichoic acid export membrane protein
MASLSEDELLNAAEAQVLAEDSAYPRPAAAQALFGKSISNMALRGVSMAARFLLMIGLAYYLAPADVGVFSLMYASTTLGILLLGARFDVYSTRAICAKERTNPAVIVRDQMVFHLLAYMIVLPLMLVVFAIGILPWSLAGWFYLLLILEHSGQECNRFFVALGQPLRATFVFFIRSGAWTIILLPVFVLAPDFRNLQTLWILWTCGGIASLLLSGLWLRKLGWRAAIRERIDWAWIKRGLKPSATYTVALGSTMLVATADRYFLGSTWDYSLVGVYGFYASLTNFVPTFAETGIISILLPSLLSSTANKDWESYRKTLAKLTNGVWIIVVGASVLSVAVAPLVLVLVGKEPIYGEYIPAFALLLSSAAISTLSLIPHNALYANHKDRVIAKWSVVSMLVALVCYALLTPSLGPYGVCFGVLASSITLLAGKCYEARGLRNEYSASG